MHFFKLVLICAIINIIQCKVINFSQEIPLGIDRYIFSKSFGYHPHTETAVPKENQNEVLKKSSIKDIFWSVIDYFTPVVPVSQRKKNIYTHLYITSRKFKD